MATRNKNAGNLLEMQAHAVDGSDDRATAAVQVQSSGAAQSAEKAGTEETPTYTLFADDRFGVLGLIALMRLAREWHAGPDLVRELEAKVRQFELYAETHPNA
jgi:hypothetical protein